MSTSTDNWPLVEADARRILGPDIAAYIEECRALLALYQDQTRASADVKRIAHGHLREIEAKIANGLPEDTSSAASADKKKEDGKGG